MKTVQLKIQQKMLTLKRKLAPRRFLRGQSGVSAVISNMILIAAVIVVGFVALSYAQSMSADYRADYGKTVNSDIGKLKEFLVMQYCQYNNTTKQLTVYLLNSGTVSLDVKAVYVDNSPVAGFSVYPMSDSQPILNRSIGGGVGAYAVLNLTGVAVQAGTNSIKIVTGSDSNFVFTFLA